MFVRVTKHLCHISIKITNPAISGTEKPSCHQPVIKPKMNTSQGLHRVLPIKIERQSKAKNPGQT